MKNFESPEPKKENLQASDILQVLFLSSKFSNLSLVDNFL